MQIFVQGTSTHAVSVNSNTTVEEIKERICNIEQVAYEVSGMLRICSLLDSLSVTGGYIVNVIFQFLFKFAKISIVYSKLNHIAVVCSLFHIITTI